MMNNGRFGVDGVNFWIIGVNNFMGLSTFIEINNDYTDIIENMEIGLFKEYLVDYLKTGQEMPYNPAFMKVITLHRDDKRCKEIQRLLNDNVA